jgi:hypothetical protein
MLGGRRDYEKGVSPPRIPRSFPQNRRSGDRLWKVTIEMGQTALRVLVPILTASAGSSQGPLRAARLDHRSTAPDRCRTPDKPVESATPPGRGRGRGVFRVGTAYRIRTDDLSLERAVSWASRRMRRRSPASQRAGRDDSRPSVCAPTADPRHAVEPPSRRPRQRRCDSRNARIPSATCWKLDSPITSP